MNPPSLHSNTDREELEYVINQLNALKKSHQPTAALSRDLRNLEHRLALLADRWSKGIRR